MLIQLIFCFFLFHPYLWPICHSPQLPISQFWWHVRSRVPYPPEAVWMHCDWMAASFGSAFFEPSNPGPAGSQTTNNNKTITNRINNHWAEIKHAHLSQTLKRYASLRRFVHSFSYVCAACVLHMYALLISILFRLKWNRSKEINIISRIRNVMDWLKSFKRTLTDLGKINCLLFCLTMNGSNFLWAKVNCSSCYQPCSKAKSKHICQWWIEREISQRKQFIGQNASNPFEMHHHKSIVVVLTKSSTNTNTPTSTAQQHEKRKKKNGENSLKHLQ